MTGGVLITEERSVHTPAVVMVTGVSRFIGCHLAARLAQNPAIEHVIAVDSKQPSKDTLRRLGRARFVRADVRNPLISKVINGNSVDTVIHASTIMRPPKGGSRAAMKDMNVLGAMQLCGVIQKSPTVKKVVLRSSSAVYGSTARDPVMFTEEMSALRRPSGAFARDSIDVEGFLRGLGRRRPDIDISILRMSPLIGPRLHGAVSTYFTSPVVPNVLGRDARLQLLHEQDALASLECAAVTGPAGTFNVAGDGVVTMSQAIRRAGRVQAPMPLSLFRSVGRVLMGPMMRDFTTEQLESFFFGCGLDTTRMRAELGFEPRWTTLQAFDDFVKGAALKPVIDPEWIDTAESRLLGLIGAGAGVHR